MGTKLNYLFFQSSRLLQASDLQLLKNQCEQERTQILTILMLPLENPRLAGYMLTGNRSMFLETDGSLAWLYHCPLVHSPLHALNQCYDRIPTRRKARFNSLTLSHGKHSQRLTYKIVLIESKFSHNSTWTKKSHGIH